MFGVIGSGFGLYGHMPAICLLSQDKVFMPERYRPVFEKRTELSPFSDRIRWVKDEEAVMAESESMTLSLWPKGQEEWVMKCLLSSHISAIALEKPLAADPVASIELLKKLKASGKTFRINYAFMYTAWFAELKARLKDAKTININWTFLAHHYRNDLHNWKRRTSDGGGAIRFFGIHLIAVLSALNFDQVIYSITEGISTDDSYAWKAGFKNKEGAVCEVILDSFSSSGQFCVELSSLREDRAPLHIQLENPFDEEPASSNGLDNRVKGLTELYRSLSGKNENDFCYKLYEHTNTLWQTVENMTTLTIAEKQLTQ